MYPLNMILINFDDEVLPHVRREAENCSAHIEAEYPDIESAYHGLRSETERRLLVVQIQPPGDLEELRHLSNSLNGWPILALLDGEERVTQNSSFFDVMRNGATQIAGLPLVSEYFRDALERIAQQFVYASRSTTIVAVTGAIGGCGATSLAINLASEISHNRKLRCILIDLSLRMGMIAAHLNMEPKHTILDLLEDPRRVDALLVKKVVAPITDNFGILAGPDRFFERKATAKDVLQVVNVSRQIADFIVLDLPCSYDDFYFDILSAAGRVVLVGEQTLPAVRALRLVHEAMGRNDVGGSEHIVVNRYDPKILGFSTDRLLGPLGVPTLLTVARDDASLAECLNQGLSLRLIAPHSKVLSDINRLADLLVPQSVPIRVPAKPTGLLRRLSRAFN